TRASKRGRDVRRRGAVRGGAARAASPAPLSVVILAAGEGKRMQSPLPKVLQPLAGRPLLKHVIDTARTLAPAAIQVVYGHGGEQVPAALQDEPVSWTLQAERLGTGHAVLQAMQHIPDQQLVLVLYGDVPLIGRAQLAEYYLTGVIAMAVRHKLAVRPLGAPQAGEVLGVNDKAQLAQLEAVWRARCARALLLAGVTLADPARLDVRGELAHGTDVFID